MSKNSQGPSSKRPSWDEYFLDLSVVVASRSPDKKRQVGCVVIDEHRRVVATGYNGTPAGYDDHCQDWWEKAGKEKVTIHAEANALVYADGPRLRGGTLYSSYSPCAQCAKLIAAAGIKRVVYREASDADALELFKTFGIEAHLLPLEATTPGFDPKLIPGD
jgi:dCMP deaminase